MNHSPTLPAEMRLEPCPPHVAPLRVVQDDGDDGRPTGEKRAHHGGDADDPRDEAGSVQAVDDVRQLDQRLAWHGASGSRVAKRALEAGQRAHYGLALDGERDADVAGRAEAG